MKKVLLYFILLMAVILASTVAYVSISGLLTVFSGVGIVGFLFFLSIEVSKLVATSAIHTYGKKIGWVYNWLLGLFIIIAMGITSMGVYGFLSSGYEKNASKSDNIGKQIALIDKKIELKEKSRKSIDEQLTGTQKSITQLRTALGNNTQSRVDKNGNVITTTSIGNRKAFESQLTIATQSEARLSGDLSEIDSVINVLSESKLELETNDSLSELGPLKYLAEVTNTSMDNVMKWFILLLIIIGDPMAIIMIVIFNKIINGDAVNDAVNDAATDAVNEGVTEGVIEGVTEGTTDELFDELPIMRDLKEVVQDNSEQIIEEIIEEPKIEKEKISIKLEDLPERKNRGFSVNIPERKHGNVVERIGSNKEVRDEQPGKVFFKKRD